MAHLPPKWLLGCLLALASFACSASKAHGEDEGPEIPAKLGRLKLNVRVTGAEVNWISFAVRDADGDVVETGIIDVSADEVATRAWVLLPPGNYEIQLSSEARDLELPARDVYPCFGAKNFRVTRGDTTPVDAVLECVVTGRKPSRGNVGIDVDFVFEELEPCGLTSVFVAPTRTAANGGVVVLQADAIGGTDLEYQWTVTGPGTIQDPSSPNTTYTCQGAAEVFIRIRITAQRGLCEDQATVRVVCSNPRCGNGSFEPELTESCDASDPESPSSCTEACTTIACGDGLTQGRETCDDGNLERGDGCDARCRREFCGDGKVNDIDEECEPPLENPAPGECGPDCKTFEGLSCEECRDAYCRRPWRSCTDPDNEGRAVGGGRENLCVDVVECWEANNCAAGEVYPEGCLCGRFDELECADGSADGPCKAEMRRAAAVPGGTSASVMETLLGVFDSDYPLGDAGQYLACMALNCAASCDAY